MKPTPDRSEPTDAALVERLRAGDERALALIYDRHVTRVHTLSYAIVGSDHEAEEVTEEVFLQLWTRADRFDPERGSLPSYLATITRSRALDHVRARKRRSAAHERAAAADEQGMAVSPSGSPDPEEQVERRELRTLLDGALNMISPDQRRAIELAYFGGFTQSQIARELEEPIGTVKTRIRDGMIKLRDLVPRPGGVR